MWTSPSLDGQIYGEPLLYAGRVYVATENDTVYAMSAASGAVIWSAHLGTSVPVGSLPCSGISPSVGITGVPVIPTVGMILPQGSDAAGTGLPRCADQATVPVAADNAYTVSFSVAT